MTQRGNVWAVHKPGSSSDRSAPCPVPLNATLNDSWHPDLAGHAHLNSFCRQKMEDKKRKCWECRRRRLVCDLARPGCTRCQSAGRACPGYRLDKPLKWMQPPQEVRSRHAPRRQLELASSSGSTDNQEPNLDSHAPGTTSTTEGAVPPLERQPQEDPPHDICRGSAEQAIFILDPCALKTQQELAEIFESVEYCRYPTPTT
jgi:hypothetical protein